MSPRESRRKKVSGLLHRKREHDAEEDIRDAAESGGLRHAVPWARMLDQARADLGAGARLIQGTVHCAARIGAPRHVSIAFKSM